MTTPTTAPWEWRIEAKTSWWGSSPAEVWAYRHLVLGLIRRDFLLGYQQTVLGPLWVLLQPLMTMVTYVLVFSKLLNVSTGQAPPVLFYLAGIVLWNLFNDSFTATSSTFRTNAALFSKVYFPRLVMPLAQVGGTLISFGIQCLFLLLLWAGYVLFSGWKAPGGVGVAAGLVLIPAVALLVGAQSLGWGLLFSVLTGKYRDIQFLVGLGLRLLMFLTPVVYPLQYVAQKWQWIVQINPLTSLFELFRWALVGQGQVTAPQLVYSISFTVLLLAGALLLFNKQGDKLIDVL